MGAIKQMLLELESMYGEDEGRRIAELIMTGEMDIESVMDLRPAKEVKRDIRREDRRDNTDGGS